MNEEIIMKLIQMLKQREQGGGDPSGAQLMQALQGQGQNGVKTSKGRKIGQTKGKPRAQNRQKSRQNMDKQKLIQMMKMLQQGR